MMILHIINLKYICFLKEELLLRLFFLKLYIRNYICCVIWVNENESYR